MLSHLLERCHDPSLRDYAHATNELDIQEVNHFGEHLKTTLDDVRARSETQGRLSKFDMNFCI